MKISCGCQTGVVKGLILNLCLKVKAYRIFDRVHGGVEYNQIRRGKWPLW